MSLFINKRKTMKKELSKYFFDLSKITFATGVLGAVLGNENINTFLITSICVFTFILFGVVAFILTFKN